MKTKTFFMISVLLTLCALTASSCGDDDSSIDRVDSSSVTMTVSPDAIIVDNSATTVTLTVTCNQSWSVLSYPDWCTPSKSGGVSGTDEITFSITANNTAEQREDDIVLKAGSYRKTISVTQYSSSVVSVSATSLSLGGQSQTASITITANTSWTIASDADWCTVSPASFSVDGVASSATETGVTLTVTENTTGDYRTATLTITSDLDDIYVTVEQMSDAIETPAGYTLVWHDEFNDAMLSSGKYALPNTSDWYYETGNGDNGWGNGELQYYVAATSGTDTVAMQKNGMLYITAMQSGSQVISARMNTNESWTYGYFEMRAKLPAGKGAWPAFWMMPKNYTSWPADGEIDIMEGYYTGRVSSAIHCSAYYGGTCKTASTMNYSDCQETFHVYALEWTSSYIRTYVDGNQIFQYTNDGGGSNTWPFNDPFYIKLNLAWGGSWTNYEYDNTALPATYIVDYVRVFQK